MQVQVCKSKRTKIKNSQYQYIRFPAQHYSTHTQPSLLKKTNTQPNTLSDTSGYIADGILLCVALTATDPFQGRPIQYSKTYEAHRDDSAL